MVEEGDEADYAACVLGLRDYVEKNRFPGVVLGLSGGIDSALCAAMAVDALGRRARACVMLPYRYTSERVAAGRRRTAPRRSASATTSLPIAAPVEGFEAALQPLFAGTPRDITEENLQSRARGTILMAISNKFGADGGDDRQQVRDVGRLRHALRRHERRLQPDQGPLQDGGLSPRPRCATAGSRTGALGPDGIVIPENILTKAPTAELRENQKDQDSLPPYEVLDDILRGLVEQRDARLPRSWRSGHDLETVQEGRAAALPRRIQAPPSRRPASR